MDFSLKELKSGKLGKLAYMAQGVARISDVDITQYRAILAESFREIDFATKIQRLIDSTTQKAKEFIKSKGGFISIHIRTGDIVFKPNVHLCTLNGKFANVYASLEIAKLELAKGNNVVLFSDNLETTKAIKEILSPLNLKGRIYIIDDFLNRDSYLGYEQSIFEIIFMSLSNEIYSAGSGFSRLALLIGGKNQNFIHNYFDKARFIQITIDYYKAFHTRFHSSQSAFALMQAFLFGCEIGLESQDLATYIVEAYNLNPKIPYDMLCVCGLLLNGNDTQANGILEKVYNNNKEQFLEALFFKVYGVVYFKPFFVHFLIAATSNLQKYPFIAYFAFKIALFDDEKLKNTQEIKNFISDIGLISQFLKIIEQSVAFQELKEPLKAQLESAKRLIH